MGFSAHAEPGVEQALDTRFEVLTEIRDALQAGRNAKVRDAYDDVERALDFLATWERARRSLARGIRARARDADHQETVERFVEAAHLAEQRRMEFPLEMLAGELGDLPNEAYADRVAELIDAHANARHLGGKLDHIKADYDLPIMITFYGPEQVEVLSEEPFELMFTIENLSTRDLGAVEASVVSLPDREPLPLTLEPAAWDDFAGGALNTLNVHGTLDRDGPVIAELVLKGREAEARHMLRLRANR